MAQSRGLIQDTISLEQLDKDRMDLIRATILLTQEEPELADRLTQIRVRYQICVNERFNKNTKPLDCKACEAKGTATESFQQQTFVVAGRTPEKSFTVTAIVPMTSCSACGLSYTDYRAEEIRNRAIEEQTPYRISKDGMQMIWTGEDA